VAKKNGVEIRTLCYFGGYFGALLMMIALSPEKKKRLYDLKGGLKRRSNSIKPVKSPKYHTFTVWKKDIPSYSKEYASYVKL